MNNENKINKIFTINEKSINDEKILSLQDDTIMDLIKNDIITLTKSNLPIFLKMFKNHYTYFTTLIKKILKKSWALEIILTNEELKDEKAKFFKYLPIMNKTLKGLRVSKELYINNIEYLFPYYKDLTIKDMTEEELELTNKIINKTPTEFFIKRFGGIGSTLYKEEDVQKIEENSNFLIDYHNPLAAQQESLERFFSFFKEKKNIFKMANAYLDSFRKEHNGYVDRVLYIAIYNVSLKKNIFKIEDDEDYRLIKEFVDIYLNYSIKMNLDFSHYEIIYKLSYKTESEPFKKYVRNRILSGKSSITVDLKERKITKKNLEHFLKEEEPESL